MDGAGATRELICHISKLNARPGRRVHYSIGFDLDARARTAIGQVREADWEPVLDTRGQPRDPAHPGPWNRRLPERHRATRTRPPPQPQDQKRR